VIVFAALLLSFPGRRAAMRTSMSFSGIETRHLDLARVHAREKVEDRCLNALIWHGLPSPMVCC
jgi:hypothetical protein